MRALKKDKTSSQNLATAALSYTTDYSNRFKLEQIIIKASVNISETITITLDSASGANYDTILAQRTLVAEQNFVFRPQGEANFQAGDNIKIECTNANATGTVYVVVKAQEVLK